MHRRAARIGIVAARPALLAGGVVGIVLAIMAFASGASATGEPIVSAQIGTTPFGQPMTPGFIGVSLEYKATHLYTGRAPRAVNPVLVHKLTSVFGAELGGLTRQNAAGQLYAAAAAAEVPGFEITSRQVIGTFTYAKLPMVKDMEAAGDLLAESDLVAAIAGDAEAQQLVAADHSVGPDPESDSPEDDYSVLDADSSQRHAIDTVLAGQSLVIHGPPGTGKSQTIANLITALVAHGRKVLFVAEKRAAIDAVLSRLKGVELGDMVLDIHEGTRDRQRIAQ